MKRIIPALLSLAAAFSLGAAPKVEFDYKAETQVNVGSGDFAPYYIFSNVHGTVPSPVGIYEGAMVRRKMDPDKRVSWGCGVQAFSGGGKGLTYQHFDNESQTWYPQRMTPPNIWLQQLYAEVKYRRVFLTVGMKDYASGILNNRLSSGDLTFSGNTRPMPGFRAGFIDFVNVPLTNGWVQVQGELGYFKAVDNNWTDKLFNHYSGVVQQGWWYNYKRFWFRTKPSQPVSITFGLQAGAQFSGSSYMYNEGNIFREKHHPFTLKYALWMLIPTAGEDYRPGAHTGNWDFNARVRLRNGATISGYFQWLWEDGTGIGKLNGLDGLWGVEYKSANPSAILTGAVVEYLDFNNQSGPIHWSVDDNPGTTITTHPSGNDNYYNNYGTNGYAYYGRSIGTPFIPSPYYYRLGQNAFVCSRIRGFHMAAEGNLSRQLKWRAMFSWRKGWGTYYHPFLEPRTDTSFMAECDWNISRVPGLALKGQFAFDAGSLLGNNFGLLLSLSYSGLFKL